MGREHRFALESIGPVEPKPNSAPLFFQGGTSTVDWQTSTTLLRRLRLTPADETAWAAFVGRYGGLIYRWCREWGLQPADAEDVTQNVLVELSKQMRSFVYDR